MSNNVHYFTLLATWAVAILHTKFKCVVFICRELLCHALQRKIVLYLEYVVYEFFSFCVLTIRSPLFNAHIAIYKQRGWTYEKWIFKILFFSRLFLDHFLAEKMPIWIHDDPERTTLKWSDANRTNSRSDRSQDLTRLNFQNRDN